MFERRYPKASVLGNTPAGGIVATTVQGAIDELATLTAAEVAAQAVGFTITKGTTPKTLTVALDANVSGTNTGDQTFVAPRTATVASSATPTPNADTTDIYTVTALAEAAAFGAPTGTPTNGQRLLIRIKDNATSRALSWNAAYRAGTDVALPTATVISKTQYVGFIWNSTDSKWDLVASMGNI